MFRIPETRDPTLFDYVVEKVVPELFRFAEYSTVAGFVVYLGNRTNNVFITSFGYVLLTGVFFFAMSKLLKFVKALEFKRAWTMWLAYALLLPSGTLFVLSATALVFMIASAQVGT